MVLIYKPSFVAHDGSAPIYSIDTHPDGSRFATAGGDRKVKVWTTSALLDRNKENDKECPKLLATLADHYGPVNCCRFSKNGRYLATASTDSNIFLYELHEGKGRTMFGSNDEPNVENWSNVGKLKGHQSDVIDIAFSPDDKYLASASYDNLVNVWDVEMKQIVATLKGHQSFVKGVAWDPIGKFLATQGDDKSVIIWRVDDWEKVSTITEPYRQSVGATFSMRLCWSPDGKAVTTCNSYKKPSHTASVLERGEWDSKFDFVGHKGPVVCVRFSPGLFKQKIEAAEDSKDNDSEDKPKLHTVVACGSQDTKLTIWRTNRSRPVCVIKSCFEESVVDLSWTPNGFSLLACSTDGTMGVFTFEESEIGCTVNKSESEAFFRETYGGMVGQKKVAVLEDPTLLKYTKKKINGETTTNGGFDSKNGTPMAPKRISAVPVAAPVIQQAPIRQQQQQEIIASDGRRRITPMANAPGTQVIASPPSARPPQQIITNNENQVPRNLPAYTMPTTTTVAGVKRVAPQEMMPAGNAPKRLAPMPVGGGGGQPQRIQPIPAGGQQQAPARLLLTPPPARQQMTVQVSQQQ